MPEILLAHPSKYQVFFKFIFGIIPFINCQNAHLYSLFGFQGLLFLSFSFTVSLFVSLIEYFL